MATQSSSFGFNSRSRSESGSTESGENHRSASSNKSKPKGEDHHLYGNEEKSDYVDDLPVNGNINKTSAGLYNERTKMHRSDDYIGPHHDQQFLSSSERSAPLPNNQNHRRRNSSGILGRDVENAKIAPLPSYGEPTPAQGKLVKGARVEVDGGVAPFPPRKRAPEIVGTQTHSNPFTTRPPQQPPRDETILPWKKPAAKPSAQDDHFPSYLQDDPMPFDPLSTVPRQGKQQERREQAYDRKAYADSGYSRALPAENNSSVPPDKLRVTALSGRQTPQWKREDAYNRKVDQGEGQAASPTSNNNGRGHGRDSPYQTKLDSGDMQPSEPNCHHRNDSNGFFDPGDKVPPNFRPRNRLVKTDEEHGDDDGYEDDDSADLQPGAFSVQRSGVSHRSKAPLGELERSVVDSEQSRKSDDTLRSNTPVTTTPPPMMMPTTTSMTMPTNPNRYTHRQPVPPEAPVVTAVVTPTTTTAASLALEPLEPKNCSLVSSRYFLCLVSLVVVALALGIAIPLALSKSSGKLGHSPPTVAPTKSPTSAPTSGERMKEFIEYFESKGISSRAAMENKSSPQFQALQWMSYEDSSENGVDISLELVLLQRYVMSIFYYSMDNRELLDEFNFLSGSSVCEWNLDTPDRRGIFCEEGYVDEISLHQVGLIGTIPTELYELTALTVLDLAQNKGLYGTVAPQISSLSNLVSLGINDNVFTGTLPTTIGSLRKLSSLYVGRNALTGEIPSEIGLLRNLLEIQMPLTRFTGTIPTEFGFLTKLTRIEMGEISLSSPLPTEFGRLTRLLDLLIYGDILTGTIPSELALLTELTNLRLETNALQGTIPSELAQLVNLRILELQHNFLSGSFPQELFALTGLELLALEYNDLTGSLEQFCSLQGRQDDDVLLGMHISADCDDSDELECSCCDCAC